MSKFQIKVIGSFDEAKTLKELQDKLAKFEKELKKIKVNVDDAQIKEVTKATNELTKATNALATKNKFLADQQSKNIKEQITLNGQLKTVVTEANKAGYDEVQRLITEKDKLISKTNEEIKQYGELTDAAIDYMRQIEDINRKISEQKTRNTTNNKVDNYEIAQIKSAAKANEWAAEQQKQLTNEQIKLNAKLSESKRKANKAEYQTLNDLLSQKQILISKYNAEIAQSGKVTDKAREYEIEIKAINRDISNQKTLIGTLENKSLSIWDKLTEKAKEYFNYAIAAMTLQQAAQAVRNMVSEVMELDSSLVELRKVTDLEGASLEAFTDKAYVAARNVAKTGREMIDATTEFAKSGYDPDAALKLGEVALMYGNIADEEISAGDAASFIIAQMKAFNIEAKDAMHIIDAVNEVSNKFAVSSADIANNLGKASAIMANAGNSMEEYIAMLTAITEITRSADKAANGLKTITLRLQGMNDEGEKDLDVQAKMETLFNKLGISVYKANGELKNTYEIMGTLAPVYEKLSNAEKAYVTETIAGKYQAQNAAALLNNWSQAVKANETAINSQGSALKENAKYIDSIEGKINAFNSAFQELAKSFINSDLIKSIVSFGTAILKFANDKTVKSILKLITTFVALKTAISVLGTLKTKFSDVIKSVTTSITTIKKYNEANKLAKQSTNALITAEQAKILTDGKAILSQLALNAAIAAGTIIISLIVSAYQKQKQKAEEAAQAAREAAQNAASAFEETSEKINDYTDRLTDAYNTLSKYSDGTQEHTDAEKELKSIQEELIKTYPTWSKEIQATNGDLQAQLDLLRQIEAEEAKKTEREQRAGYNQAVKDLQFNRNGQMARDYGLGPKDLGEKWYIDDDYVGEITQAQWENFFHQVGISGAKDAFGFIMPDGKDAEEIYDNYTKLYKYIEKNGKVWGLTADQIEAALNEISAAQTKLESQYNIKSNKEIKENYAKAYLSQNKDYLAYIKELEEVGNTGQLDSDKVRSIFGKYGFSEKDIEMMEILKETNINDIISKFNKELTESDIWSNITKEIDPDRVEEFKQKLQEAYDAAHNIEEPTDLIDVVNSFNDFWSELNALDTKDEAAIDNLLKKYPQLQKAMEANGKTIKDITQYLDDQMMMSTIFYNHNDLEDWSQSIEDPIADVYTSFTDLHEILLKYGKNWDDLENRINSGMYGYDERIAKLQAQKAAMNETSTSIDNLQSAYETLSTAVDEYTSKGYITVDTLQSLVSMNNNYLAMLNLTGDKYDNLNNQLGDYIDVLKAAKLAEMELAFASDVKNLALGNTEKLSPLAQTALSNYKKETEETGNTAAVAAAELFTFAAAEKAVNGEDVDLSNVRGEIEAIAAAYTKAFNNFRTLADKTSRDITKSSKNNKSSGKEWWEKELDTLKDQFNYSEITIEEYINGLEKLLGKTQKGSDAWKKINEELQKQRLSKVEDDYKAGRISLEQYIAKLKELLKAYKEGTKGWKDLADKIKKGLQDQAKETKQQYDNAKSAVDNLLDDEIKKIDEKIDKLKEANKETEREIELARLQEALANAQKNKSKRVWNGSTWEWVADQGAIDDAQKALDDFLLEDKISELEKEKEALNDLKTAYADVTNEYDKEQKRQELIAMLGADAEKNILNDRIATLEKFRDKYLAIQKQITDYDKATPESLVGGGSASTSSNSGNTSSATNGSSLSQAEIDELARAVIAGKYGNGQARKNALGDKYSAVQSRVNQLLSGRSYASGGIVDYTGLAMLHGSPSRPEVVLNYDQIKKFISNMTHPSVKSNISNTGQNIIYNFSGDFNLPNVSNAQKFLRDLKAQVNITRHS